MNEHIAETILEIVALLFRKSLLLLPKPDRAPLGTLCGRVFIYHC